MASENISHQGVSIFKKNNYYTSDFKYLDMANRQLPVSKIMTPKLSRHVEEFTNLIDNHYFFT